MRRRGFFKQLFATAVLVAASPTVLVAPRIWTRVKSWHEGGRLTPDQAERFIALLIRQDVFDAKPTRFTFKTTDRIRFNRRNNP